MSQDRRVEAHEMKEVRPRLQPRCPEPGLVGQEAESRERSVSVLSRPDKSASSRKPIRRSNMMRPYVRQAVPYFGFVLALGASRVVSV